tara:strand:- start:40666 stop:41559 length:894 start_codon:yes stop_codon:yes gene_type:complete
MDENILKELINSFLDDKKSERRLKLITRTFVFLLILVLVFSPLLVSNPNFSSDKHTAVISIEGTIMPSDINTRDTLELIEQAIENEMCENIILMINSPGGSATQSKIIFDEIVKHKNSSDKKIYSVIDDVGASGGYYIAASGDKIFANSSSIVGSIGVRLDSINIKSLADKLGIKSQTISAGADKTILDPFNELSPEHIEHLKALINEIHEDFINDIKSNRGSNLDENKVFTGLFWTGKQAKELGLIDEVASIYDVNRDYLNNSNLVTYNKKTSILEQLMKSIINPSLSTSYFTLMH